MTTPFITWAAIVAIMALIIVCRLVHAFRFCAKGKHRCISFGSEREEFFVPGDIDPEKDCDYDYFDDL